MGKRNKINIKYHMLLIYGAIVLTSCYTTNERSGNFYCDSKAEIDVWRLPIVDPIELITTDINSNAWNLSTYPRPKIPVISYSVDSINYQKNQISIFSPYEQFIVIDLVTKTDTILDSRIDFDRYIERNGLSNKLYHVPSLYKTWVKTKKLPWQSELNILIECNASN